MEEAAAAVAAVLEAEEALVEDTAHPQCMVVAEEEVVMAVARQWDEVATEVATVLEVAATIHTELPIHAEPASPEKTALLRFMRQSQRLANEILDQRCGSPLLQSPTAFAIPPLALDPTIVFGTGLHTAPLISLRSRCRDNLSCEEEEKREKL